MTSLRLDPPAPFDLSSLTNGAAGSGDSNSSD